MGDALEMFRAAKDSTFWVIVDERHEPVGLLRERSIRPYVFSPFGWALLAGGGPESVQSYVTKCPVAEVHTPLERLAEMFASGDHSEEGVIVTDNGVYAGFLSASEIIRSMHQRDVAVARDQNPLTGLPGNSRIGSYIQEALDDRSNGYGFVYFDFDNFKVFNDTNGFREGDRAIQLFADILKRVSQAEGFFVGHVGGDDFFVGIKITSGGFNALVNRVWEISEEFRFEGMTLRFGGTEVRNRRPNPRERAASSSASLDISAAVVHAPRGRIGVSPDGLAALIATLKTSAKKSPTRIASIEYDGVPTDLYPDQRSSETRGQPVGESQSRGWRPLEFPEVGGAHGRSTSDA
jgi:GGDEF domain-containing protein